MLRRKCYLYVITSLRNSCIITFLKKYRSNYQRCRSSHRRCSIKKVVFKISETSQENPCVEAFFNKVAGLDPASFLKKKLQHKCFPVKFAKLLRTPILKNICKRLLLEVFYKKAVLKNFAIFIGRK